MTAPRWGPLRWWRGRSGLILLAVGEALILWRHRPVSDYYFPFVWLGFALLLDAGTQAQSGTSLWVRRRGTFLALFPISVAFWWLFELLNVAVRNWSYVGAGPYTGWRYVAYASLDFSTVLPAVWSAASLVAALLPPARLRPDPGSSTRQRILIFAAGIAALILPVIWPRYTFGLVWVSLLLLLDPINDALGRPSILSAIRTRTWSLPLALALGTLLCGLCWELWNYWSMPKWMYSVPYVSFWHVFEMPLLGYSGYLPFGLELFAMTNFVLPLFGLRPLSLFGVRESAVEASKACAAPRSLNARGAQQQHPIEP